ncbi:MAG: hypothetical protein NC548_26510 [Lachnospiraceae bacterium]|nr:hypothetical protein [Lachnospiraceae bacterium]
MTRAELLDAAKLRVRKTAKDGLDADVRRLIETAVSDLGRIGVHASWLAAPADPLIIEGILAYVKANYSIAGNYDTLIGIYNMVLSKIKITSKYFAEMPPEDEPGTGSTEDGGSEDTNLILVSVGESAAEDVRTAVFAEVDPVGRDEYEAAGQQGMKAEYKFTVWAAEYGGQEEAEYNGRRLSIYRTYGARGDDKTELYAAERAGNGS